MAHPFDPRQHAWNAVAAGSTGSGKTFFSAILAMATHAAGARVVIVDRGSNTPPGPWLSATRVLGGQHVSMDPATGAAVNPCDLDWGHLEPDANKVTFLVTLISRMVSTAGAPLDGYERGIVEAAVRTAYARRVSTNISEEKRDPVGALPLRDIAQSLRMLGAVAGKSYGSIGEAMASMSAIGWSSKPPAPGLADFHRTKRKVHGLMRKLDRESRDAMHGIAFDRRC